MKLVESNVKTFLMDLTNNYKDLEKIKSINDKINMVENNPTGLNYMYNDVTLKTIDTTVSEFSNFKQENYYNIENNFIELIFSCSRFSFFL